MRLKIISQDKITITGEDNRPLTYLNIINERPVYKFVVGVKGIEGQSVAVTKTIYTAGGALLSHTPVALVGNVLFKLSSDNPLHQFAFVGFTKTSVTEGKSVEVEKNVITLIGWGLTQNTHYLAGVNGSMITQNVTSGRFTKVIGFAESSDSLLIVQNYTSIYKN